MTGNDSPPGAKRGGYKRVAESLRHEIESGKIGVGHQLPTHFELVERYAVSRATVQRALKELQDAGYVESEQGRGVFVADWRTRARVGSNVAGEDPDSDTVELDDAIAEAFEVDEITIDAYCLTAESLHAAVMPQIKRIQRGELRPRSIQVRLMLPRIEDVRLAIPRRVDDPDDPRPLTRLAYLRDLHTGALRNVLEDLAVGQGSPRGEEGLLHATVAARTVPITPVVKSYVINGRLGLTGYYVIEEREVKLLDGETVAIYDVLGIGAELYRQRPVQVDESRRWFNSLWDTIAVGDGQSHEPGTASN